MRYKIIFLLQMLSCSILLSSCVFAGSPDSGGATVELLKQGISATASNVSDRTGRSCSYNILNLVTYGDASIESAKANGGIDSVRSVDQEITGVNLSYIRFCQLCTIVTGNRKNKHI